MNISIVPNRITFDPSQPIEVYLRVNRAGTAKRLVFTDSNGLPFDISGYVFEFFVKETAKSEDKNISLTVANGGLSVSGDDNNQLNLILTSTHTDIRAKHYYGELYESTQQLTWLNAEVIAHNGKFDGVSETDGITISLDGEDINITVEMSGGGGDGDVVGPASATNNNFPQFDGLSGKLLKNSPYGPSSFDAAGSAAAAQSAAIAAAATDATTKANAAQAAAQTYADGLVVGLWDDRGSFDASVNAYPSSGGSGTAGAIKKGDIWTISVAGTLPTAQVVEVGDVVRALVDTPGNTQANWSIQQNNIGYTAENSANKENLTIDTSTTKYPTVNLLKTGLDLRQLIVNAAVALVDGATIDLTAFNHTLTTSSSTRTFTKSYTGDTVEILITLNATACTITLPSGWYGIYGGEPSGTNTLVISGATSGDLIAVSIHKVGSTFIAVGKNIIR